MLASISLLGERARGNRWGLTALAYGAGSIASASALGAGLGEIGHIVQLSPLGSSGAHRLLWLLALAAIAAGSVDLWLPGRFPTVHRQVDEDWLRRYRGWVYGLGFGLQLGTGLVTIVTTATVYAWMVAAVVVHEAWAGALVGAGFGGARALALASVRNIRDPSQLRDRLRALAAWSEPARIGAGVVSVAVGAGCAAAAAGGMR